MKSEIIPKALESIISNYEKNRIPVDDLSMLYCLAGKMVTQEKIQVLLGKHYTNIEQLEIKPLTGTNVSLLENNQPNNSNLKEIVLSTNSSIVSSNLNGLESSKKNSKESSKIQNDKKVDKSKTKIQSKENSGDSTNTKVKKEKQIENVHYITKKTFMKIFETLPNNISINELKRDINLIQTHGEDKLRPTVTEREALIEADKLGSLYNVNSNDLLVLKKLGYIDLNEGKNLKESVSDIIEHDSTKEAFKQVLLDYQGEDPLSNEEIEELLNMMIDEEGNFKPNKFVQDIEKSIEVSNNSMKEVQKAIESKDDLESTTSSNVSKIHSHTLVHGRTYTRNQQQHQHECRSSSSASNTNSKSKTKK